MSSSNPHRTGSAAPRKRRERDGGAASPTAAAAAAQSAGIGRSEPGSNRLLAGYLAHEFLAHGTLFGQKWDPARSEATPLAAPPNPNTGSKKAKARAAAASSPTRARPHAYADVARLLKSQGAHVEGIVNPSELARWLQI